MASDQGDDCSDNTIREILGGFYTCCSRTYTVEFTPRRPIVHVVAVDLAGIKTGLSGFRLVDFWG